MAARRLNRRSDCDSVAPLSGRLEQDDGFADEIAAQRSSRSPRSAVAPYRLTEPEAAVVSQAPVWLTVAQVAQCLQVSPDTVRGWIASGELHATDVTAAGPRQRRHFRIAEADLQDFLERRAFQPLRPQPAQVRTNHHVKRGSGQPPLKDYFSDSPQSPALN